MLEVKSISHQFSDESPVLHDLSMSVSSGEIVALLGASGCGKSTLLRLIAGLLPIQAGLIDLKNGNNFSFVFQEPSLMPWATVLQNACLPQRVQGQLNQDEIEKILTSLEIENLAERYPAELSGGQKMRVSIARALAANPKLLLLDEPFAALDELLRFKMNDLVLKLRKLHSITTVFVTHSIYEATYLADRVLIMKEGAIVGSVNPKLDRNTTPEDQRSSAAFMVASRQISVLLSGEQA